MVTEISPGFVVVKAIIGIVGSEIGLWVEFADPNIVRTLYKLFPDKDKAFARAKQLTSNVVVKAG